MFGLGKNLSSEVKLTKVSVATAAGTAAIDSDSVDMSGWEGVWFFTTVLAITGSGVQSINAAQCADDSTFLDLEGTGITIADDDDNQTFGVDVYRPKDRYVRLEVARATQNSAFGEIYALQYGPSKGPADNNVDDTITTELHLSPAEGTA
jgi:hypothetical protein